MYRDLTRGSIVRPLLLFALPMLAGDLLQQLYNIADTLIVSRVIVPMHYRGEAFGYDVISTLDAFAALFPAQDVRYLDTDTFTLTPEAPQGVVVPKL